MQYLAGARSGIFPQITFDVLKNESIKLPATNIQVKIAKILDNVNNEIRINNINNNLYELCNAIYFDTLNSFSCDNFIVVQIKEIANCILGGTPSRAKDEYWNGNINWINSGEINKFRIIEPSELITELGLRKSSTNLLPKGTTVLAITGATLGQVSRLEIESCANQSVIGIVPNNKNYENYLYLTMLNNIDSLILNQTGGAQQHINKNDVETFEIAIPDNIVDFNNKVKPLFEKISLDCFENKKLSELRDTLLPKLMNGEIGLENIEM